MLLVLDLHVVADHDTIADIHVLTERTAPADRRTGAHVNPVPDSRTVADCRACIDYCRGVNLDARQVSIPAAALRVGRLEPTSNSRSATPVNAGLPDRPSPVPIPLAERE